MMLERLRRPTAKTASRTMSEIVTTRANPPGLEPCALEIRQRNEFLGRFMIFLIRELRLAFQCKFLLSRSRADGAVSHRDDGVPGSGTVSLPLGGLRAPANRCSTWCFEKTRPVPVLEMPYKTAQAHAASHQPALNRNVQGQGSLSVAKGSMRPYRPPTSKQLSAFAECRRPVLIEV